MFEKIDNRIIGLQKSMLKDAIGSMGKIPGPIAYVDIVVDRAEAAEIVKCGIYIFWPT
jgi:hypothetical protein